ncbi:uncharacterized protein DNG_08161 [Cephalotrichum gorgonifer]|uniref:Antigenic cell wall galactomannoprotein n=1 Tax=Cephalotrichum gorgonifer TaxID=2041049 RepID=A0AAE8SY49_9PEZI|nr:uncharacterized protein DNG_08161 [Cephalotrichum gorgonifer]
MLPTRILGAVALAVAPVLADGAAIADALGTLSTASAELNNTVAEWSGDLFGALPIVGNSVELLAKTKDATSVAEESADLTQEETLMLAGSLQGLITDIDNTLSTLTAAKPKFDKLLFSPAILIDLKIQKKETDNFSAAVVAKVPAALQGVAQGMVDQVDALFDAAIDAFKLF